jgi:hypothetical protein
MKIITNNIDIFINIKLRDNGFYTVNLEGSIRVDYDIKITENLPYSIREYFKLGDKATYNQYEFILPSLLGNRIYRIQDTDNLKVSREDLMRDIADISILIYNIQEILDLNKINKP